MRCGTILAVLTLCWSLPALAQAPGGVPPLQAPGSQFQGGADARAAFARYGEDYFLDLNIGTTFTIDKFAFGIQAPLRIRVIDEDPQDDQWYRDEDWDDVSDWTRILRFFQYATPKDPFYLRLGELVSATIGHGTIVNRYYNTLDIDHYYTGLWTAVNLDGGGAELMTNDVLSWTLVATRGYVRPFVLAMDDPHWLLQRLATGVTFAADWQAPSRRRETGLDDPGQRETEAVAWMLGIDADLELYRSQFWAITPYTDLNFLDSLGTGWHLGVLNEFQFLKSQFQLRLEYRLLSSRYGPTYFNTLYDIERWTYLPLPQLAGAADNLPVPKYWYFKEAAGLELRHGFYGELFANILGLVGIGGIYEDYQGPDNASVTLRADLPAIAGVKLGAWYTRRNFDGFSELFDLDEALLVAEASVKVLGPLYVYGVYSVYWEETENAEGYTSYDSTESFQAGVGASFTF